MMGAITSAGIIEFLKYSVVCGLIGCLLIVAVAIFIYALYKLSYFLYAVYVSKTTTIKHTDGYIYKVIYKRKWTYLIVRYPENMSSFKPTYEYFKVNINGVINFDKDYIAYRNIMFLSAESAYKALCEYLKMDKESIVYNDIFDK